MFKARHAYAASCGYHPHLPEQKTGKHNLLSDSAVASLLWQSACEALDVRAFAVNDSQDDVPVMLGKTQISKPEILKGTPILRFEINSIKDRTLLLFAVCLPSAAGVPGASTATAHVHRHQQGRWTVSVQMGVRVSAG